jgi:hypothetical protein
VTVALLSQHAMCMRLIILPSVARPAVQHFFTLALKGQDFRKNKLLNIKCVFGISVTYFSPIFLILNRIERDYHKRSSVFMSSARYSCQFLMKLEFSRKISEKSSNIKFYENLSSGR